MLPTFRSSPLPLVLALQAAIASPAFAANFDVGSGTTATAGKTLNAGESGSIAHGAALSVAGDTVAVAVRGGASTLTNAGDLRQTGSARAIDANNGNPLFSLHNQSGATIDALGNVAIRLNRSGGQYLIDNQGTISQSGQTIGGERAIKADADYTSTGNQIINGSQSNRDAVISSVGNDALRLGSNFTLSNYGRIFSTGKVNTSCPGYMSSQCASDYSAADGVAIENQRANVAILNHGSIEGPRHGIDGGAPVAVDADADLLGLEQLLIRSATGDGVILDKIANGITTENVQIANPVIINYADGVLIGHNGSGVGLDGHGVVFNYGLISGRYAGAGNIYDHEGLGLTIANGDGDGVDIDGIAYIENHGRIEGLGAGGLDSGGRPNGGDGIAAGGGTIRNLAGASIFGQSAGILIDDGANGSEHPTGRGTLGDKAANGGVAYIVNAGEITGADKVAVGLVGSYDDVLINEASGVIRGGLQAVRVDTLDSTSAAAAVQMGAGNDRLINAGLIEGLNGLAVDLGDGDDSLTLRSTARFIGVVDGGAGTDSVTLDDTAGGSFGNSRNFENLDVRNGAWRLNSDDFSANTRIYGGASLLNLGTLRGDVQVDSGATFGGGTIGGNLDLASGSTLALAVSPTGASNGLQVGGNVSLNGARLRIDALAGDYPQQSRYQVLQADGAITGRFADLSSNLAFLTPTLQYTDHSVDLNLTRNDRRFADLARNANGSRAASALESQGGGTLYDAVLTSSSDAAASAIDQLSASSNASLMAASLAGSALVGSSMLGAMQQMGGGASLQASLRREDGPLLAASGVPNEARNLNDSRAEGRLWLQGIGSHGRIDGSKGTDDLTQDTRGALLGADWAVDAAWRVGVLGGYARTDVDAGRGASSDIDSLHLGVYAQRQSGALALRLGAAYSRHANSSKRQVDFAGFTDRLRGDYDANSQQAFAELGYQIANGRLLAEPFAALGYQRYSRESYDEKGGAAALHVDSQAQDNLSSTLGLRVAHLGTLGNGMSLTPRASLGWRHTYGDLDSQARQSFLSGGSAFSVEGTALDRDSLLADVGLDLGISSGQSLGLGYSGEHGSRTRNHALVAQWQLRF